MRAPWLVLVAVLAACGGRPSPRAAAAAEVLRVYAADLRVGERIRVSRRKHPALTLAPALGYRDSSYRAADGFGDLVIVLEGMPTTPTVEPAQGMRSLAIQLSSTSPEAARTVEARLRSALGRPREGCRDSNTEGPSRMLFWPHDRGGTALTIPVGPWQLNLLDAHGKKLGTKPRYAVLVFTRLDPAVFLTSRQRCPPLVAAAPPRRR